ncbi:MAG: stage II sporulation protein P [Clostridia bacterium]|nr:stage II sporulation protein P [Clostridia bacterium]
MKRSKCTGIKDAGWILKIISAVLILTLTLKFAIPISSFMLKIYEPAGKSSSLSAVSRNEENTTAQSLGSIKEIEAEAESEAVTESDISDISDSPAVNTPSEYITPQDIKDYEQEYLSAFSSLSPKGKVSEVFFRTSGSTDKAGDIYIKNATATKKPDFEGLLSEGPELYIKDASEPVVLIFHTHTTESYLLSDNGVFYEDFDTRSTDSSKNMLRIGDEICKVLKENNIGYIHDENTYDESYEGAYARSRVTVEEYLRKYPSIKIVLDVHRDAIYYSDTSHCKPTAEINGKKAAQIMIITGAEEGYITDFPNWEKNLRFALCFQQTAEEKYPGLMKPIYFCQRKYNMDTSPCSVLLEVGTDANTLDEAMYSGYLTGNILSDIIKEYSEG